MTTEILPTRPTGLEHIQITLEEVHTFWHRWLQRKHEHLGPAAMKRIKEQGDHLIRGDHTYWADNPMAKLYDLALERVEAFWTLD